MAKFEVAFRRIGAALLLMSDSHHQLLVAHVARSFGQAGAARYRIYIFVVEISGAFEDFSFV